MSLLVAQALSCERGGLTLFDQLGFSVNAGEIVQIVGPNGSGKTTLLRLLAGLSSAYEGSLQRGDLSSFIYLGHKPGIKAMLSPLENLRWYVAASPAPQKTEADILHALAQWQLQGYEHQPCYQLSAGQQQRVALSRLLLSQATLWLLDEPFTAIDHAGVLQLESLLLKHADRGGAVVLTSHHVFRRSDRLRFIALQQAASESLAGSSRVHAMHREAD